MSAYMLEKTGFEQLATKLNDIATTNLASRDGYKYAVKDFLFADDDGGWDNDLDTPENIKRRIQIRINNLISANQKAVNSRYDENTEEYYFEYSDHKMVHWSEVQLIKHLQSLKYQMSEGDVPETKIYKLLDELIKNLSVAYVGNRDEYEKAQWGW